MGLSDLPLASGQKHKKVFEKLGWQVRRNGEHIIMTHQNVEGVTLSIPNHKEVRRGTLQTLVRLAGYTDKQYKIYFETL